MNPSLTFQGGTLVLRDVNKSVDVRAPFQWIKARWRCEAYHYQTVRERTLALGIRDGVPRWRTFSLRLSDGRQPHDYQQAALAAWETNARRGSIVLPTGAGKTYVAIQAIARIRCSTVVVAPTIDLLHQWYARLVNVFERPTFKIGVYYGSEKQIEPITVTTYHSAGDLIAERGNQFKLVIYDEVHHLPAPSWGETALMSPAPYRLGLTATYPDETEKTDGRWQIADLIGEIVFEKRLDELVGQQLAEYRTERIRVELSPEERVRYDNDFAVYIETVRTRQLVRRHGAGWFMELMRLSSFDREARRAMLARQRLLKLVANCNAKIAALEQLMREHVGERVLIFTDQNEVVYRLARRFLIPALTHETRAAERKQILDAFRSGEYRALITSKVLNEGIDVPEAKIAIVLGGSAGAREYVQRLGRVLRKVGNRQAILYEIIVQDTIDAGKAQRRRPKSIRT